MSKCKAKAADVDYLDLLFFNPCECEDCVSRAAELEREDAEKKAAEAAAELEAEKAATCWKCGGSGKIQAYWRIDNGNCWACQ